MLMAVSPGAPVALRRSLGAGGHRSFAPALQIAVARARGRVDAAVDRRIQRVLRRQSNGGSVAAGATGIHRPVAAALARHGDAPRCGRAAAWLEPRLRRVGGVLLVILLALALINMWHVVVSAGLRVSLAIVFVTTLALLVGHLLGGPDPATRTSTAISTAARNPGLALLVATLNAASPAIIAAILAYFVIAALTLIP